MRDRNSSNLDRESAQPRGPTGDGHARVPTRDQRISNGPREADDEFEDVDQEDEETEEDDGEGGPNPII
jgi:hypothetical protein